MEAEAAAASGNPDGDLITIQTECTSQGTLVRVLAPARGIRMGDITSVLESLDINLVSYAAERDPDAGAASLAGRRKQSFRGRFLVTDDDGNNLSDESLEGLIANLQDALHVRLSSASILRRCGGSLPEGKARRDSVVSYATETSMDPESPSFGSAAAAAAAAAAAGGGGGFHPFQPQLHTSTSHLYPGQQPASGPPTAHPSVPGMLLPGHLTAGSNLAPVPHAHLYAQPHVPGGLHHHASAGGVATLTHQHQPGQPPAYNLNPHQAPHPPHHQQPPYHHEHTTSAGSMVMGAERSNSSSMASILLRAPSAAISDHGTNASPSSLAPPDITLSVPHDITLSVPQLELPPLDGSCAGELIHSDSLLWPSNAPSGASSGQHPHTAAVPALANHGGISHPLAAGSALSSSLALVGHGAGAAAAAASVAGGVQLTHHQHRQQQAYSTPSLLTAMVHAGVQGAGGGDWDARAHAHAPGQQWQGLAPAAQGPQQYVVVQVPQQPQGTALGLPRTLAPSAMQLGGGEFLLSTSPARGHAAGPLAGTGVAGAGSVHTYPHQHQHPHHHQHSASALPLGQGTHIHLQQHPHHHQHSASALPPGHGTHLHLQPHQQHPQLGQVLQAGHLSHVAFPDQLPGQVQQQHQQLLLPPAYPQPAMTAAGREVLLAGMPVGPGRAGDGGALNEMQESISVSAWGLTLPPGFPAMLPGPASGRATAIGEQEQGLGQLPSPAVTEPLPAGLVATSTGSLPCVAPSAPIPISAGGSTALAASTLSPFANSLTDTTPFGAGLQPSSLSRSPAASYVPTASATPEPSRPASGTLPHPFAVPGAHLALHPLPPTAPAVSASPGGSGLTAVASALSGHGRDTPPQQQGSCPLPPLPGSTSRSNSIPNSAPPSCATPATAAATLSTNTTWGSSYGSSIAGMALTPHGHAAGPRPAGAEHAPLPALAPIATAAQHPALLPSTFSTASQPSEASTAAIATTLSGVGIAGLPAAAAAGTPAGGAGVGADGGVGDNSPSAASASSSEGDGGGSSMWFSSLSSKDSVARIMSSPVRSVHGDAELSYAKALMHKYNISALLVDTGTDQPGFITKRDFLKTQSNKQLRRSKHVREIMTQPVVHVDIDAPIDVCIRVLNEAGVRRVLVRDPAKVTSGQPLAAFVGMVSDADLFRFIGGPIPSPLMGSLVTPEAPGARTAAGANGTGMMLPPAPLLPHATSSLVSVSTSSIGTGPSCSTSRVSTAAPQALDAAAAAASSTPAPAASADAAAGSGSLAGCSTLNTIPSFLTGGPSSVLAATDSVVSSGTGLAGPSAASTANGSAPSSSGAGAVAAGPTGSDRGGSAGSGVGSGAGAGAGGGGLLPAVASAASSCSLISQRLGTEASFADRYRCAAALWELDFTELEITRRIGEGSFGEVLLASFRGTKVAVKRLRGFDVPEQEPGAGGADETAGMHPGERGPSPTQMPIFRQFFEREIEILATIRHPNVVNFIGACHTPPNVCLVTEYCARGSLDHLLHKSGIRIDIMKKVEFSMDIARGMSCLHSQKPPIIHRDLKTANLLVSARFEVKVADFGLSRIKDHAQLINSRAGLEGTVEYAAPEVLRGEPYTEKCDIWSYAVLLWELLHRQRPYADTDVPIYILMMSLGNGSLRLPPVREEAATPGLARLVERCMAWVPADRPSFREVLHCLEAEYKILRGKAAAVPRSDSASSMVVTPGAAGANGQQQQAQHAHPHPHGEAANPTGTAAAAAAGGSGAYAHPHTPPLPRPHQPLGQAYGTGALPAKPSIKMPSAAADGDGAAAAPAAGGGGGGGRRVQLVLPLPVHSGNVSAFAEAAMDSPATTSGGESTPSQHGSRPPSSRGPPGGGGPNAATRNVSGGSSGKPGSASRPSGRSLRAAVRSKSMPLPEFEWFPGEEDWDGSEATLDSNVQEEDGQHTPALGSHAASTPTGRRGAGTPSGARGSGAGEEGYLPPPAELLAADSYGRMAESSEEGSRQSSLGLSGAVGGGSTAAAVVDNAGVQLRVRVAAPGGDSSSSSATSPRVPSGGGGAPAAASGGGGILRHPGRAFTPYTPFGSAAAQQGSGGGGSPATGSPVGSVRRRSVVNWADEAPRSSSPAAAHSPSSPAAAAAAAPAPAAPRPRPAIRLSAFSPFAGASAQPWSPRNSVDEREREQQQQRTSSPAPASGAATPVAAAAAAAAAASPRALLPPGPPRVSAFSPFAQLATAALPFRDGDESGGDGEEDSGQRQEADQGRPLGSTAAAEAADVSLGVHPAVAAASMALSEDVAVAAEKDQEEYQRPAMLLTHNEAEWGGVVLGRRSKAGAANDQSPGGGSAAVAATATAVSFSPMSDVQEQVAVVHMHQGEGQGLVEVHPHFLHPHLAHVTTRVGQVLLHQQDGEEQLSPLPLDVAAGEGLVRGGVGASTDESTVSQFTEDDDDAALHTTAWVRL